MYPTPNYAPAHALLGDSGASGSGGGGGGSGSKPLVYMQNGCAYLIRTAVCKAGHAKMFLSST
jgi:hypothetical protein